MSYLSKALDNLPVHTEDIDPAVFKAARRWDALTSPETIEKGAKAWAEFEGDMWGQFSPPQKERIRDVIEAVLRAVAGVEEGNNE